MAPLFLLLYLAPIAEELWIAWHFGQLCRKDAGIFVNKTVEVEGFFNATGSTLDLVRPGNYKFIEAYRPSNKGGAPEIIRLEFGDAEFFRQAVERYEKEFSSQKASEKDVLRVNLDERTEALLYPQKGDSWRITKLEKSTARYHYLQTDAQASQGHKLSKFERVVIDSQTRDLLARETVYGRGAPWFYIGLAHPVMQCPTPGDHPLEKHGSVFNLALIPNRNP